MSETSKAPDPTAAEGRSLGYFLCWAVVFADIGTSVYYTPGILYHQVGVHAALFVCMTLVVFILLTIKYAEVAIRYPEGGGVVTVASRAIHALAGLVGGLFILVDYFLTSALSALSGVIYLGVLLPALGPVVVPVTVLAIAALGVLNLMGVKSSARARAVDPNQFISILGGFAAGPALQGYVAVSGALLLVFASNTALIGAYHVFLALSRMRFLPALLQRTNRWRGTPHWAVIFGAGIPLAVVAVSRGDLALLGDLYAFGLLGAFTMTCLSLDIVRWHERREQAPPAGVRPAGPVMLAVGLLTTALLGPARTAKPVAQPPATPLRRG